MNSVLDKKYTKEDSTEDILKAISKLALDKRSRILLADCIEWQEQKMKEIARLSRILIKRVK